MRFSEIIDHLESSPGVYMMLAKSLEPIYIGKAKDLKKRLKQYFLGKASSHRISVMLSQVVDLMIIMTQNESEALILENKLIKEHQPKYNILLKDDKSFPYLCFSKHDFPRLEVTRSKKAKGDFFGPYTNQGHARMMLDQIQRVFQIRNCSDHFFRNRTRPCLQYEISRCTAPCVGKISKLNYDKDVKDAERFLKGGGGDCYDDIVKRMQAYAEEEDFERAAACRDLLQSITTSSKSVSKSRHFFYIEKLGMQIIVMIMLVDGEHVRDTHYDVLDIDGKHLEQDWLQQYIYQYYQLFDLPSELILPLDDVEGLETALGIKIKSLYQKTYAVFYKLMQDNMAAYLKTKATTLFQWPDFWKQLQVFLGKNLTKIICIDVSHNQGDCAYAAMVVCGANGMEKDKYRSYKVSTKGDDYLAIEQALAKKAKSGGIDETTLVIIDGGVGQLKAGLKSLSDIRCPLTSISKGPKREWGQEKFYSVEGGDVVPFRWPEDMMKYVLHIRDEAHYYSVKLHRRALRKQSLTSVLDRVEGIGDEKKKKILQYFGGLTQLQCAKIDEIEKVPGVGSVLAKRIFQSLHIDRE